MVVGLVSGTLVLRRNEVEFFYQVLVLPEIAAVGDACR
jgi:hypothetical protein